MTKKTLVDIAERAGWTFVQTFVAVYTIGGVAELKSAAAAALVAAIATPTSAPVPAIAHGLFGLITGENVGKFFAMGCTRDWSPVSDPVAMAVPDLVPDTVPTVVEATAVPGIRCNVCSCMSSSSKSRSFSWEEYSGSKIPPGRKKESIRSASSSSSSPCIFNVRNLNGVRTGCESCVY